MYCTNTDNEHMSNKGFGAYGKSKIQAENNIIELCDKYKYSNYVILRLAPIYGNISPLNNKRVTFIQWIINSLLTNKSIELYSNEYRTPIYIDDLIEILRYFIVDFIDSDIPLSPRSPPSHCLTNTTNCSQIYNVCGSTTLSRYEMGKQIATILKIELPQIKSVTLEQKKLNKLRPKDISMNNSKLRELSNYKCKTFNDGLTNMLQKANLLHDNKLDNNTPTASQRNELNRMPLMRIQ